MFNKNVARYKERKTDKQTDRDGYNNVHGSDYLIVTFFIIYLKQNKNN